MEGETMEAEVKGTVISVQIVVNGIPQPVYRRLSDNKPFVEALIGTPYIIRVIPRQSGRIEVISSVDGRNTLENKPGHPIKNQGMVIRRTWDILGYRVSETEVAEFVFSDPEDSLATGVTGGSANAGVIGIAVYREYVSQHLTPRRDPNRTQYEGTYESFDLSKRPEPSDAGTAAGDIIHDPVGKTKFERATEKPVEMIIIQYRTRAWLERNGILVPEDPNPWPGWQPGETGYDFLRRR